MGDEGGGRARERVEAMAETGRHGKRMTKWQRESSRRGGV